MDAHNKLRKDTDAHRYSSKLWGTRLGCCVWFLEEFSKATLTVWGTHCLYNISWKTNVEPYFHFLPFLKKQKSLDFFRLMKVGINEGLS